MVSHTSLVSKDVGPIGYGLMGLTWEWIKRPSPPQSEAFEAMSTAFAQGATFWNGGELYGTPKRNSNHLLREYFEKYPDQADKIVLSIKGGTKPGAMVPDGSEANARRSVEDSLKALGGTKGIDIFEYARVDPNTPIEETMGYLKRLVEEGLIKGVGLSEVKASTIDRASKIVNVAAVEVELSLWATDILNNGVAETCARLNIPIVAYSPLMRGALTDEGAFRSNADIPEDDFRKSLPKFQDEALAHNNKINDEIAELAKRKGATRTQVAISWVANLSGRTVKVCDADGNEKEVTLPLVIPIPGSTNKDRVVENSKLVELSDGEMKELQDILDKNPSVGERYPASLAHLAEG